jgi:hypothetical protein
MSAAAAVDAPLAPLTTLRLGGPAKRLVSVASEAELVAAVREADEPLLLLAGGSNLVLPDAGWPGLVVRIETRGVARAGEAVEVQAGEPWDDLVAATVADGLAGFECLSGIPGSVGATPIQNVGAYGQEVSQTIASVRVWDRRLRDADPERRRLRPGGGRDRALGACAGPRDRRDRRADRRRVRLRLPVERVEGQRSPRRARRDLCPAPRPDVAAAALCRAGAGA